MKSEKIQDICEGLIKQRKWPHDSKEIASIWEPIKQTLSSKEQIALLTCLIKNDNIFKWLYSITYLIPDLFSESEAFINLLQIVVDKVKGDMAQGIFIRSLIDTSEKKSEVAIRLYSRLIEIADEITIEYSGLILGGAAKKKFSEVFKIIKKGLKQERVSVKIACIKALRVAFEASGETKFPPEILDILDEMATTQDRWLLAEITNAYIDFNRFNPVRCEQKIIEFVNFKPSMRNVILYRLWFVDLQNKEKEIEILKICSEEDDPNVLEGVLRVLSRKGQSFLEDSLEITKKILSKPYTLPEMDYYLKEMCKNDMAVCQSKFEEWKKSENHFLSFRVKMLLQRGFLL